MSFEKLLRFTLPLLSLLLVSTGCSAFHVFTKTERVTETRSTAPAVTNVTQISPSNFVSVVTPSREIVTLSTNFIYEVSPEVKTAQTILSEATKFIPAPFSGAVDLLLLASSGLLGAIARIKSKQAALVPTLIQGVEMAGSPEVKQKIQQVAEMFGHESRLNSLVQRLT